MSDLWSVLLGFGIYLLGMIPAAFIVSYFEKDYSNVGFYLALWPIAPIILIIKFFMNAVLHFAELGEKLRQKKELDKFSTKLNKISRRGK